MARLRAFLALTLIVVVEVAALGGLRLASRQPRWQVDWSHLWRWMDVAPGGDVAVAVGIVAGIVVAGYLLLTTALYLTASLSRSARLVRTMGVLTVPGVRRVVERTVVVGVSASVLFSRGVPATAQPAGGWADRPAVVQTLGAPAVPVAVAPTATDMGSWPVAHGDNLWAIAVEALAHETGRPVDDLADHEIEPVWAALCDQARADGVVDVNLIYPGQVMRLPTTGVAPAALAAVTPAVVAPSPPALAPAPVPVTAPVTAVPVPAVTVVTAPAAQAAAVDAPAPEPADAPTTVHQAASPQGPAVKTTTTAVQQRRPLNARSLLGGGLLATGIVAMLGRRRRRSARLRPVGEAAPAVEPDLQEVERVLRVVADADAAEFVEVALRALGARVDPTTVPWPIGFIVSDDALDVVLSQPAVAPPPFRGRSTHWTLSRSTDLGDLRDMAGDAMPMPAVVTLGHTTDGQEVVIDLEDPGLVSIVGPGAEDLVTAAGLQLATAPWAQGVSVVLIGFPAAPTGPMVRAVDSLADVLGELEDDALTTASVLVDASCQSTFEARVRGVAEDTWTPTVIVCATPLPDHLARRLVGLTSSAEAAGVAALVVGHVPDAPWALAIHADGSLPVEALGVTVSVPQRVSEHQAVAIRSLLEAAAQAPVPVADPDEDPGPASPTRLVVNVFGPPALEGPPGVQLPRRGKSIEALYYLACNRQALNDRDRLMGALWPEGAEHSTFNTTMFEVAQTVGRAHFPKLKGAERLYRVDDVVTSADALQEALLVARSGDPEGRRLLREAVERVVGRPFDSPTRAGGGSAWEWAFAEAHISEAARLAVEAAHRLVELALGAGDHDEADWAARTALRAEPTSLVLRRDQMEIAAARHDPAALEAAFQAIVRDAESDEDDPVDPVSAAHYKRLHAALA